MNEEIYVVTAADGNRFVSSKDKVVPEKRWNGRWVATKSGNKVHLFAEGYITEWVRV